MKQRVKKLWLLMNVIRSIPAILSLYISKDSLIIKKDIERWIDIKIPAQRSLSPWFNLHWLILNSHEFRNLFYYRIKRHNLLLAQFLKVFYSPLNTLYIYTPDIGPGLYIQHGFSTIISAKKIGKNCSINQQVTIGYTEKGNPVIGDNVLITSGAKVFGGINIGNNSKVGANCVVVKDVPSNCTVVGIPARIVKQDGERVNRPL
ncbi:serine acetyltransferase [Bacillus cereus]|nr:serine acetyltransferase [Bacillus cereus]